MKPEQMTEALEQAAAQLGVQVRYDTMTGDAAGGGGLLLGLLLLLEQGFLLRPLHLRPADEVLPADQHERRQHDGDDGVFIVHQGVALCRRPRERRESAPTNSALIRSNDIASAALRPIST